MNKIFGYVRVSTNKQYEVNQHYEIEKFAERNSLEITDWIEETISGTKDPKKRKLGEILEQASEGDMIICTELSRLGRSSFMVFDILNFALSRGIAIWTIREQYRLGTDIQSTIMAFCFSIAAQLERDMISSRTKESLARKRAEGIVLGRPKGTKNKTVKLSGKEEAIKVLIEEGHSYSEIARLLHCDRSTLVRFIKNRMGMEKIHKNTI